MRCPMCKTPMRSVSALTHGCVPCKKLYLMVDGRLRDYGDWPVVTGRRRLAVWVVIGALVIFAAYICWVFTCGARLFG